MKCFDEDYSYLDDKKPIWEDDQEYDPSSDEGELISERSPEKEAD